jgi:hypothetical protein
MLGSGCGPEPKPTGVLLPSQTRYRDQHKAPAYVATIGDVVGSEPTIAVTIGRRWVGESQFDPLTYVSLQKGFKGAIYISTHAFYLLLHFGS